MSVRRDNGTGNVRQRGNGKWDARMRDASGTQRYLGSFDTEDQAEVALLAYREQPVYRIGEQISIIRLELQTDGSIAYGVRDHQGTVWKLALEPWK